MVLQALNAALSFGGLGKQVVAVIKNALKIP